MSEQTSQPSTAAEVAAALATYDTSRAPEALQAAADQIVREDGTVPPDPAAALQQGRERLRLWLDLFARLRRDLDPDFDPDHPPSLTVAPPKIGGAQLPPGVGPDDIADPAARKKYEEEIAKNSRRIEGFKAQFKLYQVHRTLLERAVDSLKNARDTLSLPGAEIAAAIRGADLLPSDRDALLAWLK